MDQFDYYSPLSETYEDNIEFNNNNLLIDMEFDDINNYLSNLKNNNEFISNYNLLQNHMFNMHQIILNSIVNKESKKTLITKLKKEMDIYITNKQ